MVTTFFYFGSWYFCKKNELAAQEQPGGVIEMSVPGPSGQTSECGRLNNTNGHELGHCSEALVNSESDLDVNVRDVGNRAFPLTQHESAI